MSRSVLWFRRDLRLHDNPALLAAAASEQVLPLFVIDPRLWGPSGPRRRAYLAASLRALDASIGGALVIRRGNPAEVVAAVARDVDAGAVHVAADYQPYGRERDNRVQQAQALAAARIELVRTGSPYVVAPGRVRKADGEPYTVYSPFYRAWLRHGWRDPAPDPGPVAWLSGVADEGLPDVADIADLPIAGEDEARRIWQGFLDSDEPGSGVGGYGANRERPDLPGTTRMSVHLKYGEVHPRTMLADLAGVPAEQQTGAETLRGELAWRDFYADVLFHRPDSARAYYKPAMASMHYDSGPDAAAALSAWQQGRTGFPIVDAGMRQLLREGWMHNRLRMIVASFLVKDLHLEWTAGARWFMRQLVDGELSSNQHGWQWVAGSGTDAAPYFRIFNPVTQGQRFDPDGDYVRRYVPELRHLPGRSVHTPWEAADGYAHGYPEQLVDHGVERREALARYQQLRE